MEMSVQKDHYILWNIPSCHVLIERDRGRVGCDWINLYSHVQQNHTKLLFDSHKVILFANSVNNALKGNISSPRKRKHTTSWKNISVVFKKESNHSLINIGSATNATAKKRVDKIQCACVWMQMKHVSL